MGFVVLAVGALLSAVGAYEIYYGNGVIAVERGWSAFIGGSVLFAGGIVTAAVGLAIHVLLDLRRLLTAAAVRPAEIVATPPERTFAAPYAEPASIAPATFMAETAPEAAAIADNSPTVSHLGAQEMEASHMEAPQLEASHLEASHVEASHSEAFHAEPPLVEPPAAARPEPMLPVETVRDDAYERAAAEPPAWRAEAASDATSVEARDEPAAPPTAPALPHAPEPAFAAGTTVGEAAEAETPPPPPPRGDEPGSAVPQAASVAARETPASTVIGRYESEGTSYVMYADGSIDAQSSAGVYRFSSMAELKRFIEG